MPDQPKDQCTWVLSRVAADLQDCKMWPVRLGGLKHQEELSALLWSVQTCRF